MRNKIVLLLVFLSLSLFSQNIDFVSENFSTTEQYNKAIKNIKEGDKLFFTGDFKPSLPYFLEAQKLNNSNALLNFKIGVCYYKLDKLEKSHPYFLKSRMLDRKIDPKIDYALACSYQAIEDYKQAIHYFDIYLKGLSGAKRTVMINDVQAHIDYCNKKLNPEKENIALKEKAIKKVQETEEKKLIKTKPPVKTKKASDFPKSQKQLSSKKEKSKISTIQQTGTTYRIQISSAVQEVDASELKRIYLGTEVVSSEYSGGRYRYFVGDFKTLKEAKEYRKQVNVKGAFIVRFKNGKKQ